MSTSVNFLGLKFRKFKCTVCKKKFRDFGMNKDRKCAVCAQPELHNEFNQCNCYSCEAGRYMRRARENV